MDALIKESCSDVVPIFREMLLGSVGATKACTTVINLFGTALEQIFYGKRKFNNRGTVVLLTKVEVMANIYCF